MKRFSNGLLFLAGILFIAPAFCQTQKSMKDYLSIPEPIVFNNKSYNLSWSSHPAQNFYKHEYIVKGDNVDKFQSMILIDVITGNTNLKEIVAGKVEELKKLKAQNPVVNYQSFDNPKTGEYIIDFLLTANAADGTINIAEHNIYRYKKLADKSGKTGVVLFGISTRSYGSEITTFLNELKTSKNNLVNQVAQFNIPSINITN